MLSGNCILHVFYGGNNLRISQSPEIREKQRLVYKVRGLMGVDGTGKSEEEIFERNRDMSWLLE